MFINDVHFFLVGSPVVVLVYSTIVIVFFPVFLLSPLCRFVFRLAPRVSGKSMFGLISLGILSVCQIDRKIFIKIYENRSCFFPLLQNCIVYLFLRMILVDRMRTRDQFSISIMVPFVFLLFWLMIDEIIPPYLACVASSLYNFRLVFLKPEHFSYVLSFFITITTGDTEQSSSKFCFLNQMSGLN